MTLISSTTKNETEKQKLFQAVEDHRNFSQLANETLFCRQ